MDAGAPGDEVAVAPGDAPVAGVPPARIADAPPPWGIAVRDVLLVAAVVVGGVLGAVALTGVLPVEVQRIVFHSPLAIALLAIVTALVLWRTATRRPPAS